MAAAAAVPAPRPSSSASRTAPKAPAEVYFSALLRVPDGELDDTRFNKLTEALLSFAPQRVAQLLNAHAAHLANVSDARVRAGVVRLIGHALGDEAAFRELDGSLVAMVRDGAAIRTPERCEALEVYSTLSALTRALRHSAGTEWLLRTSRSHTLRADEPLQRSLKRSIDDVTSTQADSEAIEPQPKRHRSSSSNDASKAAQTAPAASVSEPATSSSSAAAVSDEPQDLSNLCFGSFKADSVHVASHAARLLAAILTSAHPHAIEFVAQRPHIGTGLRERLLIDSTLQPPPSNDERLCSLDVVRMITCGVSELDCSSLTNTAPTYRSAVRERFETSRDHGTLSATPTIPTRHSAPDDEGLERGRRFALEFQLVPAVLALLPHSDRIVSWRAAQVVTALVASRLFGLLSCGTDQNDSGVSVLAKSLEPLLESQPNVVAAVLSRIELESSSGREWVARIQEQLRDAVEQGRVIAVCMRTPTRRKHSLTE